MKNLNNLMIEKKESKKIISNLKRNILKIKLSLNISLNEEQQKSYDHWNHITNNSDTFFEPYENEKQFLIKEKEMKLNFEKSHYKSLICREKGHKEEVMSTGNHGTYVNCKRCGTSYTRNMNSEEGYSFHKLMTTPFNI